MIIKTAPFGIQVDYFRLFYEYFEEKVSDFLFVKSGSVIIFFLYNLVANFAREYESSHDQPRTQAQITKNRHTTVLLYRSVAKLSERAGVPLIYIKAL